MQHLPTLDLAQLATVTGGFDWNHAIDNGNLYGRTGTILGAGVGLAVSAVPTFGVGATAGSVAGGTIGGVLGFAGGFAYDAYQQLHGAPSTPAPRLHW